MTASQVVTAEQTSTSTRAGFNLVDDPWIPLRPCGGGPQQDVSLRDALVSAGQWVGYPDDDSQFGPAVLRFLTAFTYVVSDLAGCSNRTKYLSTFNDLWDRGQFDRDRVERYLDRHKHRFWLFGDDPGTERWMQNQVLSNVESAVPLVESGLIPHASPSYVWGNQQVEPVTEAAAARYLLAFMCYGRGGGGPKHPDADPTGSWQEGRLRGRVSVHPIGATLFETLLLNTVPAGDDRFGRVGRPEWETTTPAPSTPLKQPVSVLEQLTGRWEKTAWLFRNREGFVDRVALATGRRRTKDVTETDPYTAMRSIKPRGSDTEITVPVRSTAGKAIWRDVASLRHQTSSKHETHILESLTDRPEHLQLVAGWVLAAHRPDNAKDKGWDISMISRAGLCDADVEESVDRLVGFADIAAKELWKQLKLFLVTVGCEQSPQKSRLVRAEREFWTAAETTYRHVIDRPDDTETAVTSIRNAAVAAYETAAGGVGNTTAAKHRNKPDVASVVVPVAATREHHRHALITALRKHADSTLNEPDTNGT